MSLVTIENHPLRGLFGVYSPRPEAQLVAPQPIAPTENIGIKFLMIEQLLANPYVGDGTEHHDMHLIYAGEIYGLFKLSGLPGDEAKKKAFPLSLNRKAFTWHTLCDYIGSWNWNQLKLEFHQKKLSYASSSS